MKKTKENQSRFFNGSPCINTRKKKKENKKKTHARAFGFERTRLYSRAPCCCLWAVTRQTQNGRRSPFASSEREWEKWKREREGERDRLDWWNVNEEHEILVKATRSLSRLSTFSLWLSCPFFFLLLILFLSSILRETEERGRFLQFEMPFKSFWIQFRAAI